MLVFEELTDAAGHCALPDVALAARRISANSINFVTVVFFEACKLLKVG
jgi:hypothetical protein